ncbi:CDP-alcohol phosphatidyltransferase family protein [Streptomyces sp. NPDC001833]|uniref:CDP-alcohol phosphatidyltransferase family protein n=1 Tax=Streptomyces sp. NPDC001833 TaxID=3154658 RepID=UPI00331715C0
MLVSLRDPANALTGFGLILAVIALAWVLDGNCRWAAVFALIALMIDHIDGPVARRLRGRGEVEKKMGAALDSFADIVSAGAWPVVLILAATGSSVLGVLTASALVLASATRLSYFSIVGLDGGHRFTGLPVTYTVPVFSLAIVVSAHFDLTLKHLLLPAAWLIAVCQVAPIKVRALAGIGYAVVTAVVAILIAFLATAQTDPLAHGSLR